MAGEKRRILLADDDPDALLGLRDRLESFGFQVTAVSSGREVIEEVKKGNFGLVFMDVNMPEMDGIEALRELRRAGSEPPVIMITSNHANAMAAFAEGAQGYLLKPVNPDQLRAVVDRWMSRI